LPGDGRRGQGIKNAALEFGKDIKTDSLLLSQDYSLNDTLF
jgi:hypothetical protein